MSILFKQCEVLRHRLELRFLPGIDVPSRAFDLTRPEAARDCFSNQTFSKRISAKQRTNVYGAAIMAPSRLLNDLVCRHQKRLRDSQPERFRSPNINHELKLVRLFDRQIARLGAS